MEKCIQRINPGVYLLYGVTLTEIDRSDSQFYNAHNIFEMNTVTFCSVDDVYCLWLTLVASLALHLVDVVPELVVHVGIQDGRPSKVPGSCTSLIEFRYKSSQIVLQLQVAGYSQAGGTRSVPAQCPAALYIGPWCRQNPPPTQSYNM